jgi:hypothetical protein
MTLLVSLSVTLELQVALTGNATILFGAGRGNRTPMKLPSLDFESSASTNSAIPALGRRELSMKCFASSSYNARFYHLKFFRICEPKSLVLNCLPI